MLLLSRVQLLGKRFEVLDKKKGWSCRDAAVVAVVVMQLTGWRRFDL